MNAAFDSPIHQRISHRARRLRIDVSARRGVVVVVPAGTSASTVDAFLHEKRAWIRRACERVQARAGWVLPEPGPAIPDALNLRALGETWQVETVAQARPRIRETGNAQVQVAVGREPEPGEVRDVLTTWLKVVARQRLVPRLEELAASHRLHYRRTTVRGQRTRWASCSGRGTISLNFKLLFLPRRLVDHVLLHELAHTRHLNHSPRFWRLLASLDPDWRTHHDALSRAGRWLPAWIECEH